MSAVQSLNAAVDLLADAYSLESLSDSEQQALAALIWAIYFDSNDDPQSQTGAGCCDEYKAALKACTRSAFVYLAAMWLGVPILPDPLGVVQDAYACIRKADKDYKHCCNE